MLIQGTISDLPAESLRDRAWSLGIFSDALVLTVKSST